MRNAGGAPCWNQRSTAIKVIDTDTHVIEPYDLWTSRLDVGKWGDKVPHVRLDEALPGGRLVLRRASGSAPAAAAAQAGWSEFPPQHPPRLDDVDPATWEASARLNVMDKYGIWAAVLYPNVAGFGAGKMLTMGDGELMLACVRAYNDFLSRVLVDRPRPLHPDHGAAVLGPRRDRAGDRPLRAQLGHKGVIMTGEPFFWGMPKLADPHWDRLWAMTQEAGLSVNFHIGSGDMSIFERAYEGAGEHANYAGFGVQFGIGNVSVIANLITGGVCHRFPDQKFVSVESGVGWIPFALAPPRLAVAELRRARRSTRSTTCCPSEYFKRQMYGCFWFENDTVKAAIEQMGPELLPVRERLPAPDEHGPRPGDRRRRAPPVHRRGARRPARGRAAGRPPRQRRQALPPRRRSADPLGKLGGFRARCLRAASGSLSRQLAAQFAG